MRKNITDITISVNTSIRKAMEVIAEKGFRCVIVVDDKLHIMGIVTDGDIRKYILKEIDLNLSVRTIMNTRPICLEQGCSLGQARDIMIKSGVTLIPIIDGNNRLIDYLHLPELVLEMEKNGDLRRDVKRTNTISKVLVIGGAGYIGSVLVRRLIDLGYKVRVMDILLYGDESIKDLYCNKDFEFIRGDCRNMQDVVCALDGVDAVVHLGEIVGDSACSLNPDFTIEVNYMATRTLAEACCYCGISKFIFSSSCSVYGINNSELDEESSLNPVSLYAKCKVESERAILSIKDDCFSPVVLRLATVYGFSFRMRFDLVINLLTAKAITEKKIKIFDGTQWRPFVSINDVTETIIHVLQREEPLVKRKIFNVGSNQQNFQLYNIGELFKKVFPGIDIETMKDAVDRRNYKVKFDRLENWLGFKCNDKIIDGIIQMKDYILSSGSLDVNDSRFSNYRSFINSDRA